MKVTAIETLRLEEFPDLLRVQVHSDEGLTGLGETLGGRGQYRQFLEPEAVGLAIMDLT